MQAADKGTVTADTDTVTPAATEPLPGFMDAMDAADPLKAPSGHPEEATAVDADAKVEAPEAKPDTPAAKQEPEAKAEETPDPASTVNFDGFSDKQKTTCERLLKAGHATADEVEELRKGVLRQDRFSQKTLALAKDREELEKWKADKKEDLTLLEWIRSKESRNSAWMKMNEVRKRGEEPSEDSDSDEFDEATKRRLDRRDRERDERTAGEQREYLAKKDALETAVSEAMETHSITKEQMDAYMVALKPKVPKGMDPVKHFTPSALVDQIEMLHEVATAKAEAAKLREQSAQKTSKAVQASKQSLPPTRRTSEPALSGLSKAMADLGVAKLSDVQGSGWEMPE